MAGDGHGAQGDGEVSGTAIECPLERATLTLDVTDLELRSPMARRGYVACLGFDEDLDAAADQAPRDDARSDGARARHPAPGGVRPRDVTVDLRVTQVVNQVKGVHAILRT